MFGYVVADKNSLSDEESVKYKSVYCGLCHVLKEKYPGIGRISLNYDMVFLILLLSSLYNSDFVSNTELCYVHPLKKHVYSVNEITQYAADMNLLLSYWAFVDKIKDDNSAVARRLLVKAEQFMPRIEEKYTEKSLTVSKELAKLGELEKEVIPNADACAKCFGRILKSIFAYKNDVWTEHVGLTAQYLGEFIYTMDAVCDLERDKKKGSFNPFLTRNNEPVNYERLKELLTMQIADCVNEFELLPIEKDRSIMQNILYSGVWLHYDNLIQKKGK